MSLTHTAYESMVRHLRLPYRGIETTSVVGPFFWSALDSDDDDPHLRMRSCFCPFPCSVSCLYLVFAAFSSLYFVVASLCPISLPTTFFLIG